MIAARQKIVTGAVGMVEMALKELGEKGVVDLDDERRASMVGNLMVALCSESGVHRTELEAWAQDEMRSVNGQIEYLLKLAVHKRKSGRAIPDGPVKKRGEAE